MSVDFLYESAAGRAVVKGLDKVGFYKLGAWCMHQPFSKVFVPGYIRRNNIDMSAFEGQEYCSFADFFGRKKDNPSCSCSPETIISPCDGLLSAYTISENLEIPMKGSFYHLPDLIPDENIANEYKGGMCFVLRLQASDYHHFCMFDDGKLCETHYIPGQLHSVQPIALENFPVFRLNRRWWSVLKTEHFGDVLQVEVGAMMVGGVSFAKESGFFARGEEMGNFELAGSTILLLFKAEISDNLVLLPKYQNTINTHTEAPIKMCEPIGNCKLLF